MSCSISGVIPEEPVVSLKSGHLFEKSLIEKKIEESATCPVTNEDLSIEDLLAIKMNPTIKPRAPNAADMPAMLQLFTNEWEKLILESHTLKQHMHVVRQQLANALYQNDAARRVIARLVQERDEARAMLLETQNNVAEAATRGPVSSTPATVPKKSAATAGKSAVSAEGEGITDEVIKNLDRVNKKLSKGRKKRVKQAAAEVVSRQKLKRFTALSSHTYHSSTKQGVLCLDIHPTNQDKIVTGGVDGDAIIFDKKLGKKIDVLHAHKKRITDVLFHPEQDMVFTTSQDSMGAVWGRGEGGKYKVQQWLRGHTAPVVGCSLHPSGDYLVTASQDRTWAFHDLATGVCRKRVVDEKIGGGYTRVAFHPDGLILGAGTSDSLVRIFDVKQQKNVANFKGHVGELTGLCFSENGYYLASADTEGNVKLWDLRKLQNFKNISSPDLTSIKNLQFDSTGSYLAAAGDQLWMYSSKDWELVNKFKDHNAPVTDVMFGRMGNFFCTTSMDRTVKIWGTK